MTEAADAATSALQDISILLGKKGLTISEEKTASMMIASSFFHQYSQTFNLLEQFTNQNGVSKLYSSE